MEKMISWQAMVGWFKFSRSDPLTLLFSFIIFVSCLIIKTRELVQWQGICAGNIHDLGSSPRFSLSQYYFPINNHMQVQCCCTIIHLPNQASTRPASSITRLRIREHHRSKSTRMHAGTGVKRTKVDGPELLGLNLHFGD